MKHIDIEGYTPTQILALPPAHLEQLVLIGAPILFRVGSAQILGEFAVEGEHLVVELAQIEGGGEGVLPTLWLLCERLASQRGLVAIEWIVHALNCAQPNPKLRRLLERRGFEVRNVSGRGQALYFLHVIPTSRDAS